MSAEESLSARRPKRPKRNGREKRRRSLAERERRRRGFDHKARWQPDLPVCRAAGVQRHRLGDVLEATAPVGRGVSVRCRGRGRQGPQHMPHDRMPDACTLHEAMKNDATRAPLRIQSASTLAHPVATSRDPGAEDDDRRTSLKDAAARMTPPASRGPEWHWRGTASSRHS